MIYFSLTDSAYAQALDLYSGESLPRFIDVACETPRQRSLRWDAEYVGLLKQKDMYLIKVLSDYLSNGFGEAHNEIFNIMSKLSTENYRDTGLFMRYEIKVTESTLTLLYGWGILQNRKLVLTNVLDSE